MRGSHTATQKFKIMENLEWWQIAIVVIIPFVIGAVLWIISWKYARKCCDFLQTFFNFNDKVYIVLRVIFAILIWVALYWIVGEILGWNEN